MVRRVGVVLLAGLLVAGCGADDPADDPADGTDRWRPGVDTTWQWQLTGRIDTSYEVDAYDVDLVEAGPATVDALHADGRRVICYFSAGSAEQWRPDNDRFATSDPGEPLDGWPGERWLDIRSDTVRAVMTGRLDLARDTGCDAVEPDNVDGYLQDTGFDLDVDDQLDYLGFLVEQAHERGLAIGLKNTPELVDELVGRVDFAVVEQCHEFDECAAYAPLVEAGVPVFVAEYDERYRAPADRDALCEQSRAADLRTLVLPLDLDDSFRWSCDD